MAYKENNKFYQEVLNRKRILQNRIMFLNTLIERAPEGRIRTSKEHGHTRYYYCVNDYIGTYTTDEKLISSIMQKDYAKKTLVPLQRELKSIEALIKNYSENACTKIFDNIKPARKSFVTKDFREIIDEKAKQKWEATEYEHKEFAIIRPEYQSLEGNMARSKSEANIMNVLDRRNIPYMYEFPIYVNDILLHPDFRALNTRTGEVIYWEHWGKMDNPMYVNKQLERVDEFKKAGVVLGVNLFVTMESGQHVLTLNDINDFIDNHLV